MPPGRTDVLTAAGRSVTLSWTEPDDDGGCKIGNYIVEYYRVKWGQGNYNLFYMKVYAWKLNVTWTVAMHVTSY
jgi:hypothetical protein